MRSIFKLSGSWYFNQSNPDFLENFQIFLKLARLYTYLLGYQDIKALLVVFRA